MAQRRAYLTYYSPVLLLRANESSGSARGKSWLTNFDFDRDGDYGNNSRNWNRIGDHIDGSMDTRSWRIRPTVYTYLLEFMEPDGSKSVVLLYHVYHARDARGIHDWERIEIRVDDVDGTPGGGAESVRFATITEHLAHPARLAGEDGLNFQDTGRGTHVMVWQAQWSNTPAEGAHSQELRFVEDSIQEIESRIANNDNSGIHVSGGDSRYNVHYVFACSGATDVVNYWDARALGSPAEAALASRRDSTDEVGWDQVVRIQYELQDIADIFPTHWVEHEDIDSNWEGDDVSILLDEPILDESGGAAVPAGLQTFLLGDVFDDPDTTITKRRDGYPHKQWMWGAYNWNSGDSRAVKSDMFNGSPNQPSRSLASGIPESDGNYWWQHDYFAHDGGAGATPESGRWLPAGWYRPQAGGWDGRWVQLFPDTPFEPWWVVVIH